ncbi:SAP domain-containing ribonucleoprotein [Exaiptasia diaphana]|uniref:SAP domain-containing protein n=1 Tax=Exaiptasia diaphana TaxID=2652724 RepID=A0A913WPR3_EXADI|nr:SAP domain-containing ribonucleoprotein [Exaiptasia diaphana]KXJ28161.1 SAP domain-containing ribonucleoprotein [Exaiptasia diaphana]
MADAAVLNVKKLKVAELKKELALHSLDTKGNKSELQARLKDFLQQQGLDVDHTEEEEGENDIDDELDHEEAEDLLADESLEQKTDIIAADIDVEKKDPITTEDEKQDTAPVSAVKKTIALEESVKPQTEEEKRLQRMKRFGGAANEEDKKVLRAQRFGTSTGSFSPSLESTDLSKLKKRAERFGAVSPVVTKVDEQEKLMKRKARFGTSLTSSSNDSLESKKKKRAERFQL